MVFFLVTIWLYNRYLIYLERPKQIILKNCAKETSAYSRNMFHPRSMWFVINTIMIELYFLLMGLLARYGLIIMNRRQNAHVTDMVAIFVQMHISPYQLRCFKGLYFPLTLNLWKCLPYKSFGISNWPYLLNRVKQNDPILNPWYICK